MELLDFARGPAITFAIAVFVFGTIWRLVALLALPRMRDLSVPRAGTAGPVAAGAKEIFRRMWPRHEFSQASMFAFVNGYVFHIGLALIVFAFAPHILFIRDLTGLHWPALPNNVVYMIGAVTAVSLLVALFRRLTSPVLRLISTANDYFSWFVTILPVVTGLMAASHLGARYETLLAIHILSVAALLIWLPFGKLMHAFFVFISRGTTGAYLARRGIQF